jgi:oligopeptide/dipeptide ABC transporter ATP-binding protein
MYAGRIVEKAPVERLFHNPVHPYTQGLLRSIPRIDRERQARLKEIQGVIPNLSELPPGCAFFDRCPLAAEQCRLEPPMPEAVEENHLVSCWKIGDV